MLRILAVLCVLPLAIGCGNGNVQVYPVSGQVRFNGEPMQGGGGIALVPTSPTSGQAAGGVIDEMGNYTLSTYGEGDGSMVGEFRVMITQTVMKEPEPTKDGEAAPKPAKAVPDDKRIPLIYADPKGSPLIIKVEPKVNDIPLELDRQFQKPAGA